MTMKHLIVQAYWYFDTLTGEYRYRIRSPGEALADHPDFQVIDIHVFHPAFPDLALQADILILHLLPDPEVDMILRLRKRLGKRTVFEIADNFLDLGPWMPTDDGHRNPLIRQSFLEHARRCDGLQLSSEELRMTFGGLNANTTVFENQADHFTRTSLPERPFVIGWGGSKGHEQDVAAIAPVIEDFLARHEDAVFSFMGWPPMFTRCFDALPEEQALMRPAGPIEAYFDFLATLHVGLAPLADTEFNRCRSDIKMVEYAAHGVVPVLSDAAPYRVHGNHGDNTLLFADNGILADHLERLYQDSAYRRDLAERAYRFASNRRSAVNHVGRRVAYYQRFLKHEPMTDDYPELPECGGLIAYLRIATDHYSHGRYDEAMTKLDEVLALHPNYGAAHIWRLKTMVALDQCHAAVSAYGQWQPPAIYADLFHEAMAVAARRLGLAGWRKVAGQIMDPVLRLETDTALEPDRERRLRAILGEHPFHYPSLVSLARLRAGESPAEARALLDRARFIHPESDELAEMAGSLG